MEIFSRFSKEHKTLLLFLLLLLLTHGFYRNARVTLKSETECRAAVLSSRPVGHGLRFACETPPCTLMAPGACKIRRDCNVL